MCAVCTCVCTCACMCVIAVCMSLHCVCGVSMCAVCTCVVHVHGCACVCVSVCASSLSACGVTLCAVCASMCVYMCMCVHCMYVYGCMCIVCTCFFVYVCVCIICCCVHLYALCMRVCMYVCVGGTCVCTCACLYVHHCCVLCVHVCMRVPMCVYVFARRCLACPSAVSPAPCPLSPLQSAAECSSLLRTLHGLEQEHLRRSLALQQEEDFAKAHRQLAIFQRSELHSIFFTQIQSAIFKGELKPEAAKMLLQDYSKIQVNASNETPSDEGVIFLNHFRQLLLSSSRVLTLLLHRVPGNKPCLPSAS